MFASTSFLQDSDSLCFIPGHDGRATDAIHTREEGKDGEENRCKDEFEFVQRRQDVVDVFGALSWIS